jgi:hypothetical protein
MGPSGSDWLFRVAVASSVSRLRAIGKVATRLSVRAKNLATPEQGRS